MIVIYLHELQNLYIVEGLIFLYGIYLKSRDFIENRRVYVSYDFLSLSFIINF